MADSYDLIDKALDGQLEGHLADLRAQGLSLPAIALAITDLGYPVSRETVRRWYARMSTDLANEAAS